jgi:hypothetical protein
MRPEKELLDAIHDSMIRWIRDFPGIYRNRDGSPNKDALRQQMSAYNGIRCNFREHRPAADYLEWLDRPEKLTLINKALSIY